MSGEITWGREIAVNGVRPAWLSDDLEQVLVMWGDGSIGEWSCGEIDHDDPALSWPAIRAIRLPLSHSAYVNDPTPLDQFLTAHPDADRRTAEMAFAMWGTK